jgi:acetylornithine deacetylase/succinyl-diaminopimelate desuccinylase-like protein
MPIGSPNAGYKTFNTGDVLTAAQVQYYLQNQSIMYFADAAARDAALTVGIVQEGMFAYLADINATTFYNGTAWEVFGDQTLATLTSPKEVVDRTATATATTVNVDVVTASVKINTLAATADFTLNVRGNASTTLDSLMAVGEQMSVVFECLNGATPYYATAYEVDGVGVTPKWLGGSAPVAGNANSSDVYVLTIVKTGAATFTCLASLNKFA